MEVSRSVPPKKGFLESVRTLATKNNIVLIFDECTSGFRETLGGLHKKFEVEPDLALFGKALGNGFAINAVIDKKKLQQLMSVIFHNYGVVRSSIIADRVKNLTFHYATISGISLSVEDLRVPFRKKNLVGLTVNEVDLTEQNFKIGNISTVERYQKIIDI